MYLAVVKITPNKMLSIQRESNYYTSMRKKLYQLSLFLLLSFSYNLEIVANNDIHPETYQSSDAVRSGIALGGIGTGSIELRKDGNFYNWSIFNNYPHGSGPIFKLATMPNRDEDDSYLFFLVKYQVEGQQPKIKLLQINNSLNEAGLEGIAYYYPWLSAVETIEYSAQFPFVNMKFTDTEMPFDIELEAYSPFIPHDVKNSSLPGIYFNFNIISKSEKPVDVMLIGSLRNLVGYDQIERAFTSELIKKDNYQFFVHSVEGMDTTLATYGEMGLGVMGAGEISYYLGWEHKHPYYEKLYAEEKFSNVDDTEGRNFIHKGKKIGRLGSNDNDQRCFSSIASSHSLKKGKRVSTTFFMNWNFPNFYGAVKDENNKMNRELDYCTGLRNTKIIGHYYQNNFKSIYDLTQYFSENAAKLKKESQKFLDDFYASDIEEYVLNQVNSQLNTFITSSILTKDKTFVIREGLTPDKAWGPTATIDVSLYGSQMVIALFPELQMSMMKAHRDLQTMDGEINHGLGFDPDYNQNGTFGVYDRVDLVPNYIQMVLRDYFWTNDKKYLDDMWPSIKLCINYMLEQRDNDGDQMPDMEGIMCSYDNFPMYGLASYIQSQWVSALTMAAIAANDMNESELSYKYGEIAQRGVSLMEDKLWNGNYFNLSNDYNGEKGIDSGCLTDQLIGQWTARCVGLGSLFDTEKVKSSLKTILDKSFMDNNFVRNCSWPEYPDLYPIHNSDLWVDQANTPWTGVELGFASFLIYENMIDEGFAVIKAVDDRYRKAGLYWDHQEFGGHYYRPMSAWAIINAYLGLSINRGVYSFAPKNSAKNFQLFFSGPEGTANFIQSKNSFLIEGLTGVQKIKSINISSPIINEKVSVNLNDQVISLDSISIEGDTLNILFKNEITINENDQLKISLR